jgi:hypothetical protein
LIENKRERGRAPKLQTQDIHRQWCRELDDPLLAYMKKSGIPVTRENYLKWCYGESGPPDDWGAEDEAQLPQDLQERSWLKK